MPRDLAEGVNDFAPYLDLRFNNEPSYPEGVHLLPFGLKVRPAALETPWSMLPAIVQQQQAILRQFYGGP